MGHYENLKPSKNIEKGLMFYVGSKSIINCLKTSTFNNSQNQPIKIVFNDLSLERKLKTLDYFK